MQARVEVGRPTGRGGGPTRANRIELDGGVGPAGLVQPGKCHYPTIAERQDRGIPATMRHSLDITESVCSWLKNRYSRLSVEGVVLDGSAVNQRSSVLEKH